MAEVDPGRGAGKVGALLEARTGLTMAGAGAGARAEAGGVTGLLAAAAAAAAVAAAAAAASTAGKLMVGFPAPAPGCCDEAKGCCSCCWVEVEMEEGLVPTDVVGWGQETAFGGPGGRCTINKV